MKISYTISTLSRFATCLLAVLVFSSPALAVDGLHEINQASVAASGGFPFTIGQPGSYVLTSDLVVPDANTTGISIQAADVTIDMNGFSIRCSGCTGTGTGDGVHADVAFGNVALRNGAVVGVGNRGIALLGELAIVDGLKVGSSGDTGIVLGDRALLTASHVADSERGLRVGRDSIVMDVISTRNRGAGVQLNEFAIAAEVASIENQGLGFLITEGAVIIDSTANQNEQKGMQGEKTVVVHAAVRANQDTGIECYECVVLSSNITDNVGIGLDGDDTGYGYNVIQYNTQSQVRRATQVNANGCGLFQQCPN